MDINAPAPAASQRLSATTAGWPQRPLLLAGLTGLIGGVVGVLAEADRAPALMAALVTAALVFALTVERASLGRTAAFALLCGALVALVADRNLAYTAGRSLLEWPFWSAVLATAIAAPFFQAWREVGGGRRWPWRLPYAALHTHAWTNGVIGGAALAFVALSWLLSWLVAMMFDLIGIDALERLLGEGWFALALTGAAFGAAVGLLRERDRVVAAMQRLVTVVLGVLAPLLAAALLLFLMALVGTGLTPLWQSGFSTAALMLGVAAFCVLLTNAVIGNDADDAASNPVLTAGAAVLAVMVLPLSAIAAAAMGLRIGEYGWTPDRIWGLIAAVVALGYGVAGLWAAARGRRGFAAVLRPVQQKLALCLWVLALLLALPLADFGAIAARDQLARLASNRVGADKFDFAAMAFDFGPAGRRGLEQLAGGRNAELVGRAKAALAAKSRYELHENVELAADAAADILLPPGAPPVPRAALDQLYDVCAARCAGRWLDEGTLVAYSLGSKPRGEVVILQASGTRWNRQSARRRAPFASADVRVETRPVTRRQLVIDGEALGEPFE